MDLSKYSLENLIFTAMKSEIESKEFYSQLADRVKNPMLKDKLKFLANEEEKHKSFFEWFYEKKFPNKKIELPEKTPVPLPKIVIEDENVPLSQILRNAMDAEKAAANFYFEISDIFHDVPNIQRMLLYIASMELQHFKVLEIEKENFDKFGEFDVEWPMR